MKIKQLFFLLTLFMCFISNAQTIKGTIKKYIGQEITLTGFNYYQTQELSKTIVDSLGNFNFNYPKSYRGMGIIQAPDKSSLILLLTEPNITFTAPHLSENNSLEYIEGKQNIQYFQFAKAKASRDAALMGLKYLQPLYKEKTQLIKEKSLRKAITKEIKRLETVDANFLKSLDKESYLSWFIPMRQLVQDMPAIYNKYRERIPQNIKQFRSIDFTNPNFKGSGLFRELIEGHYILLENMGQSLDNVYKQMNISTKYLIDNLQTNEILLNEVSKQLYSYFEKRSLFNASEFLSVSLLSNNQCSLNDDLVAKLESYLKLKIGVIAPDIVLKNTQKLSDIKINKLLVFGASWCPTCKRDVLELIKKYDSWKSKNLEIIYISIDTDINAYETVYKTVPWQTFCDFKGWDTQAAKDYYISGTPTYFLLDNDNKILARPYSIQNADTLIYEKL